MTTYKNRYGDKFTFTKDDSNDILWEGEFKYYRFGTVDSLSNEIDMIDPSGGPYITRGMSLASFGFKDYIVKDFQKIDTGYKIVTEKCSVCNKPGNTHKMSCSTKKATVLIDDEVKAYYDQMDKEVHQNRGNLNQ